MAVLCFYFAFTTVFQVNFSQGSGVPDSATSAAVEAMMTFYDNTTGRWDPKSPWWQTGNALQSVVDFMTKTGSREYVPQARNTIRIQRQNLSWWSEGGGEFRADSTDDTGWWALASLRMYELTSDEDLLGIAKTDEAYMYSYWNTTTCGGGLIWDVKTRSYHNAISNELYLELAASLHNLIPGDTLYLNRSLAAWQWFNSSGMINPQNLVNDGLTQDATCKNNGQNTWTYNQGVILGGLTQLYLATGNASLLETACSIADAVISDSALSPNGILTEFYPPMEPVEPDSPAFKGIFIRNLQKLDLLLPKRPYQNYIQSNAVSAYKNARNGSESHFYGNSWQGPFDFATIGRQESAVNLLVSAL
jgi:predicted alpha-1,6-mannanase (GH76 family)